MSTNTKQVLLAQFAAVHDQPNWFVPLKKILTGLTVEQATWKEGEHSNSIWQIVNHLSFWNERYLSRFLDIPQEAANIKSNDDTFAYGEELSEDSWRASVELLHKVMFDWRKAIEEADEAKLETPVQPESKEVWATTIANIAIHIAYHTGQILQIRKQQGSWNPENGVH